MGFPYQLAVNVTEENISEGQPGVPDYCPVAFAISDNVPGLEIGVSDVIVLYDYDNNNFAEYYIPPSARDFIRSVDAGETVAPITFTATWRRNGIITAQGNIIA